MLSGFRTPTCNPWARNRSVIGQGHNLPQRIRRQAHLRVAAWLNLVLCVGASFTKVNSRSPFLQAIVPAVVGGLFTLWIFGSTLSLYSIIGLFLLLGIVKKNGIMVVDFALQRIDEGWAPREAIHEAGVDVSVPS